MRLFCQSRIFQVLRIDGIGSLQALHSPHSPLPLYSYDPSHYPSTLPRPTHKDSGRDRGVYPNEGRLSVASKRRESLRPNRHSGVPERYARIMICPETSARREVPVADMRWFTFSITSTKASLRRYLMSFLRYDIAPVACIVILDESSLYKT